MRPRSFSRGAAIGALAVTVGMSGLVPAALAAESQGAAGGGRLPGALRAAVDAVGGAGNLRGLRSMRYRTTGTRFILDESFRPGGRPERSATVESRVRIVRGGLRVDAVRTSVGTPRRVSEVLSGRRGFIRGVDANFSAAGVKPMTSDRWAAIRKEQALLNPQLLLRQALRQPARARSGGTRTIGGRRYRVLTLRDNVAPIRLFVDVRRDRVAMLRTKQHDYLRRDVLVQVNFRRWAATNDGLRFPRRVTLRSDGEVLLRERRSAVRMNPRVPSRAFDFPAGVGRAPYNERLARIGERTSEWIMSFANLGFIKDGGQTAINPIAIGPAANPVQGATLLGGVANNSLLIQRDNGVVVFEGALHNHRARAVLRFIRRSPDFTGPVTHVVTTHHHADHASGMRAYVARGAIVVVGRPAVPFFRRVFRQRSSTILPDALDRGRAPRARVRGVPPGGGFTLGPAAEGVRIEAYGFRTDHASDMILPFAVDQGILFTSDIYSPPTLPAQGDPTAQAIVDLVDAQGLGVDWIVGGHGTFVDYDDFEAAVTGP
jgi:glyoxylase-like metal-dependent hydrolase (beta-lactamase superfamily II)